MPVIGFEAWWTAWTKSRAMTGLPIRPDSVKVMCQQAYDAGFADGEASKDEELAPQPSDDQPFEV